MQRRMLRLIWKYSSAPARTWATLSLDELGAAARFTDMSGWLGFRRLTGWRDLLLMSSDPRSSGFAPAEELTVVLVTCSPA